MMMIIDSSIDFSFELIQTSWNRIILEHQQNHCEYIEFSTRKGYLYIAGVVLEIGCPQPDFFVCRCGAKPETGAHLFSFNKTAFSHHHVCGCIINHHSQKIKHWRD